ncbi:hypothetical protein HOD30_01115 [Candidatus Peregrinibacteria bacterium]|jgi:hypothetical protein|nr:hypothetical protein [Candidatus Peregrinibacteria bacterium]MBT4631859.1 hypothetical protein [Candidatus Peregrinibacteria bacterium]MBT5824220.1 hypothetical protein [Candidatus Peregrinibacteria bacterium]
MKFGYHLITNFTKETGIFERIFDNFLFTFCVTKFTRRKNYLRHRDFIKAALKIKKGDLVLVGTHKKMSSIFIKGIVTHALIYTGKMKLIHVMADGVEEIKLKKLFKEYDTMVIMRPRTIDKKKIKKTIKYLKNQLGKPYDFAFKEKEDRFFCTELINNAYKFGGIKTGFQNLGKPEHIIPKVLRANDFIKGKFKLIFKSKSVIKKDNEFVLNHKVYQNTLLEKFMNKG